MSIRDLLNQRSNVKNLLESYFAADEALSSPYQTPLNLKDEINYQKFINSLNIQDETGFDSSYDMRGFYKENKDKAVSQLGTVLPDGLHFSDKYKTPFHPTFSNESQNKINGLNRSWQPNGDGTFSLTNNETGEVIRDERNAFAFPGLLRG